MGPCPESKLNCFGFPSNLNEDDGTDTFVEYDVPVTLRQLRQWQMT
jgi:hypothetical protein